MQIPLNKADQRSPAVVLPHSNIKIVIILLSNALDKIYKKDFIKW